MKTQAPFKVADHIDGFIEGQKKSGAFMSRNDVIRDALQKAYERNERLKKKNSNV